MQQVANANMNRHLFLMKTPQGNFRKLSCKIHLDACFVLKLTTVLLECKDLDIYSWFLKSFCLGCSVTNTQCRCRCARPVRSARGPALTEDITDYTWLYGRWLESNSRPAKDLVRMIVLT